MDAQWALPALAGLTFPRLGRGVEINGFNLKDASMALL